MKFGKLKDIREVDFSLPSDPPANASVLAAAPPPEGCHFFGIGCTGWSMKEWVGKVYPAGTKTRDFLRAYGRQFNTIELNTTHYRIPTPDTIRKWYEETPADFRFCPKVPQSISHSRNLGLGEEPLLLFAESVQGLEEKLGACFLQLPPYFGTDRLPLLERFLSQFPGHIPLTLELRHESWFREEDARERLFDHLTRLGMATVLTDVAGRRDVLHMRLTSTTAMIRFVGNGLHPTDYSRVDEWVERLAGWLDQGLHNVYFFTHEPDNLLAPELARYLYDKIVALPGLRSRGPAWQDDEKEIPGSQMSLF